MSFAPQASPLGVRRSASALHPTSRTLNVRSRQAVATKAARNSSSSRALHVNATSRSSVEPSAVSVVNDACGNHFMQKLPIAAVSAATLAGTASLLMAAPSAHAAVSSMANSAMVSIPGIIGDDPFREGILSGFLLIFFSELGDKTFFIALLLALKQNKAAVFTGTFGALAVMTVISVFLGQAIHQITELLPESVSNVPFDDLLAVALLVFFGIKTLQAADSAEESAAEEKESAREEVDKFVSADLLRVILSTFTLVFAAEWGDKSFLATIALSASSSPAGVVTGAVAGHGVATGLAVAGGSFLSKYFSERVLQYVGGSLFLVFAGATLFDIYAGANP